MLQGRKKGDVEDLFQYTERMRQFSTYMHARPTDLAVDAASSRGVGLGTSRPFATTGLLPVDVESSLRSLEVPLGKYGHQAQIILNTKMVPVSSGERVNLEPMVARLEFPARDVRNPLVGMPPGPPVRDDMPLYSTIHQAGISSRNFLRDTYESQ
jgi:hypothetical protein